MAIIHKHVINKALTDVSFGRNILSKLPLSSFEGDETKELVQIIKRYYISNTEPLDQEALTNLVETHLDKKDANDEKVDAMLHLTNDAYNIPEDTNENVMADSIQKFVRKALTVDLLSKTLSEHQIEEEGVIETLSDKLREISVLDAKGNSDGVSIDFFEDTDRKKELYQNMVSVTHPTGFTNLDEILLGGGLGRGELALLVASSGTGKTSYVIQVATNAVRNGLNVLYVTLEEKASRINYRIETNMLGKSSSWMMDEFGNLDEHKFDLVQQYYSQNKNVFGKLYVEKRNPREVSIDDLEQIIVDWKVRKGNDIDVVIIDYPAIMKVDSRVEEHIATGELYERIRGLAQKYNFIGWTLAQTNRSAFGLSNGGGVVSIGNVEGSKKILNSVELCLTMNRTTDEYQNNCFRLSVDKVRNPATDVIIPEFLYFKMDLNGYRISAESYAEMEEHKQLLNNSRSEGYSKENNYDKAVGVVNEINSAFGN